MPLFRTPSSLTLAAALTAAFVSAQDDGLPPPEWTEYWEPQPAIIAAAPGQAPSDAVVLFDGSSLAAWEKVSDHSPAGWTLEDGAMVVAARTGDIQTKAVFGDVQLHLEWRTPAEVRGNSQGRGNSGVFFMGLYEVQVLDSHGNKTYVNGQAGSVYKQHPPLVNASRGPGEWQVYDIVFVAPRFSPDGTLLSKARVTAFHNGVLVQHDVELDGPTSWRGLPKYQFHVPRLPLKLQDHGNPVAYRNIWIRPLDLP